MNALLKLHRSQRGAGLLIVALGVSVLLMGSVATVLKLSGQIRSQASTTVSGMLAEEFSRNSLVHAQKLISNGCVEMDATSGAWIESGNCTANSWKLVAPQGEMPAHLLFSYCPGGQMGGVPLDGAVPDETGCAVRQTKVFLFDPASDGRLLVRAVSPAGQDTTRTLSALLGVDTPPTTCVKDLKGGKIDFENLNAGDYVDGAVNDQLEKDYGVRFESIDGGALRIAEIVKQGEPKPAFEAWWSVLCKKKPKRNRLCFDSDIDRGGRRILSTTSATNTKKISFRVRYVAPVQQASFDLADVDGSEVWTVTALDAAGNPLGGSTKFKSRGYSSKRSGNSALTHFSISRDKPEIAALEVRGTKKIKLFGFGFDNFTTGLSACPAP